VSRKTRIVILGGGLAGVEVARILEKLLEPKDEEIRLVSRDNVVLFTPILHEIATSDLDLTAIVLDLTFFQRHCSVHVPSSTWSKCFGETLFRQLRE
jgi:NADH dehydrogenase FAD-containing subunit